MRSFFNSLKKKVYGHHIFRDFLEINKRYSFLDLGCGKEQIFFEFENKFKLYHGIDIKVQQKKFGNIILENKNIDRVNLDLLNKFDVILIIDVFHHLKIDSINRLLKKLLNLNSGKIIIIKDPIDTNFFYRLIHFLHDLIINREIIHFKSYEIIEKYMKTKITSKIIKNSFWYKSIYFKIVM
jgi:SAM-dependent methyltransferase